MTRHCEFILAACNLKQCLNVIMPIFLPKLVGETHHTFCCDVSVTVRVCGRSCLLSETIDTLQALLHTNCTAMQTSHLRMCIEDASVAA